MFSDTGKHWQASTRKKPFYHLFVPNNCFKDRYAWAKKCGAKFLPETLVLRAKQTENEVEIIARTNGKTRTLTARS